MLVMELFASFLFQHILARKLNAILYNVQVLYFIKKYQPSTPTLTTLQDYVCVEGVFLLFA